MKKWFIKEFAGLCNTGDCSDLVNFLNKNKLGPGDVIVVPAFVSSGGRVGIKVLYYAEHELE